MRHKRSLIAGALLIVASAATGAAQNPPGSPPAGAAPPASAAALPDPKTTAEVRKAEAEARYYEAKAKNEESPWWGVIRSQAGSFVLALAALVTAWVGYTNWRLARDTAKQNWQIASGNLDVTRTSAEQKADLDRKALQDGQYVEALKLLSSENAGTRASAALMLAFLARNTPHIPDELVMTQLGRMRSLETAPNEGAWVQVAMDQALHYLSTGELPL